MSPGFETPIITECVDISLSFKRREFVWYQGFLKVIGEVYDIFLQENEGLG